MVKFRRFESCEVECFCMTQSLNAFIRTTGSHRGGNGPNQRRSERSREEFNWNGEMLWLVCVAM